MQRSLRFATALALLLGIAVVVVRDVAAAGAVPRPAVAGSGEAPRRVRESFAGVVNRQPPETWLRDAYGVLRDEGWLWAELRVNAAADTLWIRPGTRATLAAVELQGGDEEQRALFHDALAVREGESFRPVRFERRLRRGLTALADRGHPFVNVSVRELHSDPATGEVTLQLWLAPGKTAEIAAVEVEGATHTRPDVLRRLAGIQLGRPYRESQLEDVRDRLLARDIVTDVIALSPQPYGSEPGQVSLRLHVEQPKTTGRISAAVGFVQDAQTSDARLSGSVDLALLDLFGTARQFRGRWSDDGRARRRLDLSYLEPLVLGTSLDLVGSLGQRHEDANYDTVLGDVALRLPWKGDHDLELSVGLDRTTFMGESGRVRSRQRAGVALGLRQRRPARSGLYGAFETRVEEARVSERTTGDDAVSTQEITTQTLIDSEGRLAWAFGRLVALESRSHWQWAVADDLPLPVSEQWYVGGARTVRGYQEEQFHGEQAAFGGVQLVLGPDRRGQGYVFFDLGWVKETRLTEDRVRAHETWLHGFGLGLRSPLAVGAVDLSLGFADELSFDSGKLHLSLVQDF